MSDVTPNRLVSLDLIRGVAVLGILVLNIPVMAGPSMAALSPHIPNPASVADEASFALGMLLFEGKMRALFSLLFGASMLLFIDRANARGAEGNAIQLRRLGWLALFGLAHFFLIWWGDILFLYAIMGMIALFMHELKVRTLVIAALVLFAGWHIGGSIASMRGVVTEEQVRLGTAEPARQKKYETGRREFHKEVSKELALYQQGYVPITREKITEDTLHPLTGLLFSFGETLPLMLLGMALYRSGFFSGTWPAARLRRMAQWCMGTGFALTMVVIAWTWARHFPPRTMFTAIIFVLAIPHLLIAVGYAALLVRQAPRIAPTWLGRKLVAAGQMAFTNYIACSMVMTGIFYGRGLGLFGTVGSLGLWAFVLLGWALMLGWSEPWLARYRQGPLEWLWRSLTEGRRLPFLR